MTTTTLERAFTADRVLRLTGLSQRQLQYWDTSGLIQPSLSRPDRRGHGRPRLYDFRDLVELRTAARLRDHVSLQLIRKLSDYLRTLDYEKPLADVGFQVIAGDLVFLEAGTLPKGRRPEQVVIAITVQLRTIVDDLRAQIAELYPDLTAEDIKAARREEVQPARLDPFLSKGHPPRPEALSAGGGLLKLGDDLVELPDSRRVVEVAGLAHAPRPTGHEELGRTADAHVGADRDRTAEDRDQIARALDRAAEARDRAAEARDARATARDDRSETRERAADRAESGSVADRAGALRDRQGGASDRAQSAADRDASEVDRVLSAQDRATSSIDELTDVYRREAGLQELEREFLRATRRKQSLVLAFVDVDNLKERNDALGHTAGDELLRAIADAMRARLRSYDLVIRVGGDEFICALPDLSVAAATARFALVSADLVTQQAAITVGFAELQDNGALDDLIARADAAMYKERQQRQAG